MIGSVVVMEPSASTRRGSAAAADGSLAAAGESCSRTWRASPATAKTRRARAVARGVFGKQVQLQDGATVIADETYLRESILNPQAKVVAGFQPIMPTFQGQVSEERCCS